MPAPPPIDPVLTTKNWRKKRSVLAQGNGMGKQLDSIAEAYDKVDWDKFWPKSQATPDKGVLAPEHIDPLIEAAKKEFKERIEPLRKVLADVADFADERAAEFKKSKTIPKKTRQLAESIASEARSLRMTLAGNSGWFDDLMKEFEIERQRLDRLKEIALKTIDSSLDDLDDLSDELRKEPSVKLYKGGAGKGFHQKVRAVGAALRNLSGDEKVADFKEKRWNKLTSDKFIPKKDEEVLDRVDEVMDTAADLKKLL